MSWSQIDNIHKKCIICSIFSSYLNHLGGEWTPHKVELAIWTHYIARDIKPELLEDMPGKSATRSPAKTTVKSPTKETATAETNGVSNGIHEEEKAKETESEEEKQVCSNLFTQLLKAL